MPATISQDDIEDLVARNMTFFRALERALRSRRSYEREILAIAHRIQRQAADDLVASTPAAVLCWNAYPYEREFLDWWSTDQGRDVTVAQLLDDAEHNGVSEFTLLPLTVPRTADRARRLYKLASSYAQVGLPDDTGCPGETSPLERALVLALDAQRQLDRRYARLEEVRLAYLLEAQPLVARLEKVRSDLGWAVMPHDRKAPIQKAYENLARWDADHFATVRKAIEFLSEPYASSSLSAEQDLAADREWFETRLENLSPGMASSRTQAPATVAGYVRLVQLLQRARELMNGGPDHLQKEVVAHVETIRAREAAEFLRGVPVEALDPESASLDFAALRQAGFTTVADLLEQAPVGPNCVGTEPEPSDPPCLSSARERALRLRDQVRDHAAVQLDARAGGHQPEHTDEREQLLVSLCRILHLHEDLVPPADVVQATYDALLLWVEQLSGELFDPPATPGSPMDSPEPGRATLATLENRQFEKHLRAQLEPLEVIASIPSEVALAEFAKNPERFRDELHRIIPDAIPGDPTVDGTTIGHTTDDSPTTGDNSPVAAPLQDYVSLVNLVLQARSTLSDQTHYLHGVVKANSEANEAAVTRFLDQCPIEVLLYECRAANLEACRQYGCTTVGQLLTTPEEAIGISPESLRKLKTAAAQLSLLARTSTLADLTASSPDNNAIGLVMALERYLVTEAPFRTVASALEAAERAAMQTCKALLQREKANRPLKELLRGGEAEALAQALDTLESAQDRAGRVTAQAAASDLRTIPDRLQQTLAALVSPSLARDAHGVPVVLTGFADACTLVADAWEGYYHFRYLRVSAAAGTDGDTIATARRLLVGRKVARKLDHAPLGPLIGHIPAATLPRDEGVALKQNLEEAGLTTVGSLVRASRVGSDGLDPNGPVDWATLTASVAVAAATAGAEPDVALSLGYAVTLLREHASKETQVDLADIGLGTNDSDARALRRAVFQAAAAKDGGAQVKGAYTSAEYVLAAISHADRSLAAISHGLFAADWSEEKALVAGPAALERAQDGCASLQADGGPIKALLAFAAEGLE